MESLISNTSVLPIKNNNWRRIGLYMTLLLILSMAAFLRIYKIETIPPSLNWDEAAIGYNAFTIANWGVDEWGNSYPLVFTSFRDDKHPVAIYITAISVKFLGLNEFSTRFPAALFGVLSVLMVYFLGKLIFKNDLSAVLGALFLALSPYNIHFSRGAWDMNFALFFLIIGLWLFLKSLSSRSFLLPLSAVSFSICLLAYHSSKVVIPPILLFLAIFYYKELWKYKVELIISAIILGLTAGIFLMNPRLFGLARAQQTKYSEETLKTTKLYQATQNYYLGLAEITANQYLKHYSTEFLFTRGDKNDRNSLPDTGEFYKVEMLFFVLGIPLLLLKRSRATFLLLLLSLLAPLPSSLVTNAPNASRSLFMMGSMQLVMGYSAAFIINSFKNKYLKIVILALMLLFLGQEARTYTTNYYNSYSSKTAIQWQYGMKQIVSFLKSRDQAYTSVYMTDVRSQPYIFFLYYLQTPVKDFLDTVKYNMEISKSYNTVSSFGKYHFGGWNTVESLPDMWTIYVLSPSEYDGLKHRDTFTVKNKIIYPGVADAFFMVSYP